MGRLQGNNLKLYQLAAEFSDELWSFVKGWETFDKETIGEQLILASDKVGSCLARGLGTGNVKDYGGVIQIARGHLNETMYWLNRAYSRNLIDLEKMLYLKSRLDILISRLSIYSRRFESASYRNIV